MRNVLGEHSLVESNFLGRPSAVVAWVAANSPLEGMVLDIGCGYGWLAKTLSEQRTDLTIVGMEPTAEDLVVARRQVQAPQVTFVEASAESIPLRDATVDCCVMSEVLEHLPRGMERRVLKEVSRVLKPGGNLLVTVPHGSVIGRILDPAWWVTRHRHYSESDFRRFIEGSNVDIVSSKARGRSFTFAQLVDLYVSKWIFRRSLMLTPRLGKQLEREWCEESKEGFIHLWVELRRS